LFLPKILGVKAKFLGQAISGLFLFNIILTLAPVMVPVAVIYGLAQFVIWLRTPNQPTPAPARPRRNSRPRPVFELPNFFGNEEEEHDDNEDGGGH
jgi:hypothetical protein